MTGTFTVFGLARSLNRTTALAAALVFLSTPLLFLGAASSLLDALPISGFAILLSVVIFIGGSTRYRGVVIGLALGISLWTHSLAILYIPLALMGIVVINGVQKWRDWTVEGLVALSIGLLTGGAHYVRNIFLFGAPISDNPLVFSLPTLAWNEYFIINRGLASTTAMLQYGDLKGWFSFEAFGFSFWGMAVGAIALAWTIRRSLVDLVIHGLGALEQRQRLLVVLLCLLVTYYGGLALSVLLGIDLMIKNERYLLSIQALVAVFCSFGYFTMANGVGRLVSYRGPLVMNAAALLLGVVMVGKAVLFVQYTLSKYNLEWSEIGQDFRKTLSRVPEYQLIEYLRTQTPLDSLIFSLKPADMYYAQRRQIGYLDPRLVPVYEADNAAQALASLKALGVNYIHVPAYGLPPLYNSPLRQVLRDGRATTLRYSNAGGQIYELIPGPVSLEVRTDITSGVMALYERWDRKPISSASLTGYVLGEMAI